MSVHDRKRIILGTATPAVMIEWPGGRAPSAPTATSYDPRYPWDDSPDNPLATGAAVLSSGNSAFNASAAAGATSFAVKIRTNFAKDDWVWLVNAGGQKERVQIDKLVAGSGTVGTITIRHPLQYAYATDDKIQSAVCTYTFAASLDTFFADDTNLVESFIVEWRIGTGEPQYTYFDIVRARFGIVFTIDEFYELFPDAKSMQPQPEKGWDFAKQIDAATEILEADLRLAGLPPDRLRGWDVVLKHLVRLKLGELLARINVKQPGWTSQQAAEYYRDEYASALGRACNGPMASGTSVDTDEDGSGDATEGVTLLRAAYPCRLDEPYWRRVRTITSRP